MSDVNLHHCLRLLGLRIFLTHPNFFETSMTLKLKRNPLENPSHLRSQT